MQSAAFVSCDIVGHSGVKDIGVQCERIFEINALVKRTLENCGPDAHWASGGDGGHTVLCQQAWSKAAIPHLAALREWSVSKQVPLRIAAHFGEVDRIEGADGRVQFVGDGINFSGRLLEVAHPTGIVISEAFKAALEREDVADLLIAQSRVLCLRNFGAQRVYLLSIPGKVSSHWDRSWDGDGQALLDAVDRAAAWDIVYYAKRIMQANADDEFAEQTLETLGSHQLAYRESTSDERGAVQDRWTVNPFVGTLDRDVRVEVIRAAQLVERRQGEILCDLHERGDSMFIVLRGQVGVFHGGGGDSGIGGDDLKPLAFLNVGEIVGELAFALRRPRTARLVATEDCSLLSFNIESIDALSHGHPEIASNLDKFVTSRILECVCNNSSYLSGEDGNGPLADAVLKRPFDRMLRYAERINCPVGDPSTINFGDPRFGKDGLYVLVSGNLRSMSHPEKVLSGNKLPLVYVDLPGWVVCPDHPYRVEGSDVTILRIAKDAFLGRRSVISGVAAQLLREVGSSGFFYYDVFISYTFDDEAVANDWRAALESAGLRVYMEVSRSGHYFRQRIEAGVLDSLIFVALISAHTMTRPLEQNWVRQEIDYRKAVFEQNTACIFPVRLKGGRPELLADGYTIIDAVDRQQAALQEITNAIHAVKQGERQPPFALQRKSEVHLTP